MFQHMKARIGASVFVTAAAVAACAPAQKGASDTPAAPAASAERGKYLVTVMDCNGCHDGAAFSGQPPKPENFLAGPEVGFDLPGLGVFYPPNITPHPEAGIGGWTEAQIVTAIRTGVRPDGRVLAPIMAWHNYAHLTDADAQSVAMFLKSLPPSPHKGPGPSSVETAPAPYMTVVTPEQGRRLAAARPPMPAPAAPKT